MSGKNAKVICHISTVHTPFDVRIYYRECCSLAKAGHTVYLIAPSEKADGANGVNIIPIKKVKNRFLRMLFMPWIAMATALKTQACLYHYHDPELLFMGFVLRWIFGKKVVFDIHESVVLLLTSKSICRGLQESQYLSAINF
jgi:hypothetical protein